MDFAIPKQRELNEETVRFSCNTRPGNWKNWLSCSSAKTFVIFAIYPAIGPRR